MSNNQTFAGLQSQMFKYKAPVVHQSSENTLNVKNDLKSHTTLSHFSVQWKVAIIAISKFESTFLKLNWKVGIFLTLALAVRQHLFLHDSFHVWQFIRLFQIVLLYFLRTATQLLPEVFEHFSLPSFWPLGFNSRWSVESKTGRGTTRLNKN